MSPAGPWWAGAVTLIERLPMFDASSSADTTLAAHRLEAWRSAHGLKACGQFQVRLDEAGLAESDLLALLAEPLAALARRVSKPEWAQWVDALPPVERGGTVARDWHDAFAWPFRPMVREANARLTNTIAASLRAEDADVAALTEQFTVRLGHMLAELALRTFVRELHLARPTLRGKDPGERFANFIAGLSLDHLRQTYPVLVRLAAQTCQRAVEVESELLRRYANDRDTIIDELCDGEPGALVEIRGGAGDLHRGGRSVTVLSFANGARVVYKPRSLAAEVRFGELIGLLNRLVPELGLAVVKSISRDGYGWQRFIEPRPCVDEGAFAVFYRRQGALLALLHALNGCDIHRENLVAHGDSPMLVDAETLFHPSIAGPAIAHDPAELVLRQSVSRIGLLPMMLIGEHGAVDVSGLGGGEAGDTAAEVPTIIAAGTDQMRITWQVGVLPATDNRPWTNDGAGDVLKHEADLLHGFQAAYSAIVAHRAEFANVIRSAASDEIRIVLRPTRGYHRLLTESTHPDVLRDALDRDRMFDLLWTLSLADPVRQRLVRAEIADLWAGDIPMFTSQVGSRDAWTSTGERLPVLLERSGLDAAIAKLDLMGEGDLGTQKWLIKASLATRRSMDDELAPRDWPNTGEPAHALDRAREIADEICALAFCDSETDCETVGWLGLELVDGRQWLVRAMGAGLAQGYCGVALFLAELAQLTDQPSYATMARRATNRLPALLVALSQRDDLIVAVGPDDPHGFGGIASGAGRLAELLDSPQLLDAAVLAAALAERAGAPKLIDWPPGVLDRRSDGCLTPAGVPTPGLWYGLAGIGLDLLRRGFPDRVPPLKKLRRDYVQSGRY